METLETHSFVETVHKSGIVALTIKDNVSFDVKDMIEAKKFSTSHLPNKKIYLLVIIEGNFNTSREARELLADPSYSSHQAAIAVVTKNFGVKLLVQMYLKVNKPKIETKIYKNERDAYNWLNKCIKAHQSIST
ncbi:MAG: STAS/SEC14 domain-containing protein [Bacteroidota bacterium]|nr:STAS/SEC14 domain-containing protein [Bacteroidota bacterium]